jgi:hypothetical protein
MPCYGGQAFTYLGCEITDSRNIGARAKLVYEVIQVPDTAGGAETDGQVQSLASGSAHFLGLALCRVGRGEQGEPSTR